MKGQTIQLKKLTSRDDLMEDLSEIRYPRQPRKIGESTMWRWCKDAGIPPRLSQFDNEQCYRLIQVAQLYHQGCTKNQVQLQLGTYRENRNDNRQSNKNRNSREGFWPEHEPTEYQSTFEFNIGRQDREQPANWNFAEIGRATN